MSSFYSILYCVNRPALDEKISIGLFASNNGRVFFKYSPEKLKIAKELFHHNSYNILKSHITSIEKHFRKYSILGNRENTFFNPLFDQIEFPNVAEPSENYYEYDTRFINASSVIKKVDLKYLEYLNSYANNIIQFSKPKTLDLDITENTFIKLFTKFIFEGEHKIERKESIIYNIRAGFDFKIEPHVNLDASLTSKDISNLIVPTSVWFIGKNSAEVTGEIIDFDKRTYDLENSISKYLNLIRAIKDSNKSADYFPKHFLVGNEPNKNNSVNHQMWQELKAIKNIDYVPTNETFKIAEYLEAHNVEPFLKEFQ